MTMFQKNPSLELASEIANKHGLNNLIDQITLGFLESDQPENGVKFIKFLIKSKHFDEKSDEMRKLIVAYETNKVLFYKRMNFNVI